MVHRLSEREKEILHWTAQGKTAWETGKILGVSHRTVQWHIQNATKKLNVRTTVQAVVMLTSGETRKEKWEWGLSGLAIGLSLVLLGWIVPLPGPFFDFEVAAFREPPRYMVIPITFHSATTPSKVVNLHGRLCRDHRDLRRDLDQSLIPLCKFLAMTPAL